jgi:hypothetical protein
MMQQITVGLAPRKTSFFDPLTNTYLTLDKPVQTISFDETKPERLANITHALLCQYPALVLYEGTLPSTAIEAWETKFKGAFFKSSMKPQRNLSGDIVAQTKGTQALDRAEKLKGGDAELPNAKAVEEELQLEPTSITTETNEEEVAAQEANAAETESAGVASKGKGRARNK